MSNTQNPTLTAALAVTEFRKAKLAEAKAKLETAISSARAEFASVLAEVDELESQVAGPKSDVHEVLTVLSTRFGESAENRLLQTLRAYGLSENSTGSPMGLIGYAGSI